MYSKRPHTNKFAISPTEGPPRTDSRPRRKVPHFPEQPSHGRACHRPKMTCFVTSGVATHRRLPLQLEDGLPLSTKEELSEERKEDDV